MRLRTLKTFSENLKLEQDMLFSSCDNYALSDVR